MTEKEFNLSDEIVEKMGCEDGHHPTTFYNWIHIQDVKEKVQNAQKRLKEGLGVFHKGALYEGESIWKIIDEERDKIFKEEFGDKLIERKGK